MNHKRLEEMLGAYLTGSLERSEQEEIEAHLESCRSCQQQVSKLAPIPSLLRRAVPREMLEAPEVPSAGQLAAKAAAVLRRRRRRRGALATAMAGLVGAASIVALSVPGPASSTVARRLVLSGPRASGMAMLEARAWGTQIVLEASHLPAGAELVTKVEGPSGAQQVGSWSAPANGKAVVDMATSLPPRAIRAVLVEDEETSRVMLGWQETASH
jgi:anti-sigma factor RsiW